MKLLNVQGVFAVAIGVVGLAFLADASSVSEDNGALAGAAESALNRPGEIVANLLDMSARADEMLRPDDLSDLLRVDLPNLDVTLDGNVATQVNSTAVVRKVAFGQVSDVRVYSTATGNYSTDGLDSPHVTYTGVETMQRPLPELLVSVSAYYWQAENGWTPVPVSGSNSFATYTLTHELPSLTPRGGMTCSEQAGVRVCG